MKVSEKNVLPTKSFSMFRGALLNTLKLCSAKRFNTFINVLEKNIFYNFRFKKIMLVFFKKERRKQESIYIFALKESFLDENPKIRFPDKEKKTQKKQQKYKNVLQKLIPK